MTLLHNVEVDLFVVCEFWQVFVTIVTGQFRENSFFAVVNNNFKAFLFPKSQGFHFSLILVSVRDLELNQQPQKAHKFCQTY